MGFWDWLTGLFKKDEEKTPTVSPPVMSAGQTTTTVIPQISSPLPQSIYIPPSNSTTTSVSPQPMSIWPVSGTSTQQNYMTQLLTGSVTPQQQFTNLIFGSSSQVSGVSSQQQIPKYLQEQVDIALSSGYIVLDKPLPEALTEKPSFVETFFPQFTSKDEEREALTKAWIQKTTPEISAKMDIEAQRLQTLRSSFEEAGGIQSLQKVHSWVTPDVTVMERWIGNVATPEGISNITFEIVNPEATKIEQASFFSPERLPTGGISDIKRELSFTLLKPVESTFAPIGEQVKTLFTTGSWQESVDVGTRLRQEQKAEFETEQMKREYYSELGGQNVYISRAIVGLTSPYSQVALSYGLGKLIAPATTSVLMPFAEDVILTVTPKVIQTAFKPAITWIATHPSFVSKAFVGAYGGYRIYEAEQESKKTGKPFSITLGYAGFDIGSFYAFGKGFESGTGTYFPLKYEAPRVTRPTIKSFEIKQINPFIDKPTNVPSVFRPVSITTSEGFYPSTVIGRGVKTSFGEETNVLFRGLYRTKTPAGEIDWIAGFTPQGFTRTIPETNLITTSLERGIGLETGGQTPLITGMLEKEARSLSKLGKISPESEKLLQSVISGERATYGVKSEFTQADWELGKIRYLPEKGGTEIKTYLEKQGKKVVVFGSASQKVQSGGLFTRELHDIDIEVHPEAGGNIEKIRQDLLKIAQKNAPKGWKYYIDDVQPNLIQVKIAGETKPHHAFDIHVKGEAGITEYPFSTTSYTPYTGLGAMTQEPIPIQKVYTTTLSEQAVRKGTSIVTFREVTPELAKEYAQYGIKLNVGDITVLPEAHRMKDIGDYAQALNTLIKSMEKQGASSEQILVAKTSLQQIQEVSPVPIVLEPAGVTKFQIGVPSTTIPSPKVITPYVPIATFMPSTLPAVSSKAPYGLTPSKLVISPVDISKVSKYFEYPSISTPSISSSKIPSYPSVYPSQYPSVYPSQYPSVYPSKPPSYVPPSSPVSPYYEYPSYYPPSYPPSPYPSKPPSYVPPPIIPLGIPPIPFGELGGKDLPQYRKVRKYAPSLYSIVGKIKRKGKTPSGETLFSGLEIRPLYTGEEPAMSRRIIKSITNRRNTNRRNRK